MYQSTCYLSDKPRDGTALRAVRVPGGTTDSEQAGLPTGDLATVHRCGARRRQARRAVTRGTRSIAEGEPHHWERSVLYGAVVIKRDLTLASPLVDPHHADS